MVKGITGQLTIIRDKLYEDIAEKISDTLQQGRVLDVGTGKGRLPIKIAQRNSGLEVYGLDISDHEIEAARKSSATLGLPSAPRFEVGDVSSLSFKEEYFDLVVSTFSLHHWPDQVGGLNEIYRVLKPGG
jgi:ubiquinone/menaquinone biosynthesis C-methylase UbiE